MAGEMMVALKKRNIITFVSFLGANLSCSLFQLVVIAILGIVLFPIGFISGQFFRLLTGSNEIGFVAGVVISCGTVFASYALVWFLYWRLLFNHGIKWFYWRVFLSTSPLVLLLGKINLHPDPIAMIPIPPEFNFSVLVTSIVLFPIYSIGIYRYVLAKQIQWKNTIILVLIMMVLGSVIFLSSWNALSFVY
jgi:hypothetical protein